MSRLIVKQVLLEAVQAVFEHRGSAMQRAITVRGRRLDQMSIRELVVLSSVLEADIQRLTHGDGESDVPLHERDVA